MCRHDLPGGFWVHTQRFGEERGGRGGREEEGGGGDRREGIGGRGRE